MSSRSTALIFLAFLAACAAPPDHRATEAPPATVPSLDVERYAGLWYEIARYPNRFETGCEGVTAEYTLLEDGRLRVVNRCRRGAETKAAEGVARRTGEATFEVKFAPAFVPFAWGDYWVLALEEDYSAALVGDPEGRYLWILSRTPQISGGTLERMMEAAEARGYDTDPLVLTVQP